MTLKKAIFPTLIAIAVATASPAAFVWPSFDSTEFPEISVRTYNSARNGCWTNIGEAERYASDLLARKGFVVVERGTPKVPSLTVNVIALRDGNGRCFGHIRIDLALVGSMVENPNVTAEGIYGYRDYLINEPQNLNNTVLEQIRLLVNQITMS